MMNSPNVAVETMDKITNAVKHLATYPELGHEGKAGGTRELGVPTTPFVVVYRSSPNLIEIATVLHERQRWPLFL